MRFRRRARERPADPSGCVSCGNRSDGTGPALTCPGCGAASGIVGTAIAYRTLRDGPQSRACTACELVTIVLEPDMVCPACELPRPDVNDRLRERLGRLGPGDPDDAPCVGCGHFRTRPDPPSPPLDQLVDCQGCGHEHAIPMDRFTVGQGMQLRCGHCRARTVIPDTIWCPKCGLHLRRLGIAELISAANRRP